MFDTPAADPAFPAPLKVTYSFERLQPMRLVVYDADVRANDSRKLNLNQQDFLGNSCCPSVG